MGFVEGVRNYLGTSSERVIVLDEIDPLDLSSLTWAVVLLHAEWSGPSVVALKGHVEAFDNVYGRGRPELISFYVLNVDKLTEPYLKKLPGHFGGNGETFIVRNGVIVFNVPRYFETFELVLRDKLLS